MHSLIFCSLLPLVPMIYSVIEYCLNCLNGAFHTTPNHMRHDDRFWLTVFPIASLYIAFWGINTFRISFIIVQILMLYGLISQTDREISRIVSCKFKNHSALLLVLRVFTYPLFYSLASSMFLHRIYQISYKRSISISGRISHSICNIIIRSKISNIYAILILKFFITRIINRIILKVYFRKVRVFNMIMFSLIGSYYFLKTYSKIFILALLLPDCLEFNVTTIKDRSTFFLVAVSYLTLLVMVLVSCKTQMVFVRRKKRCSL